MRRTVALFGIALIASLALAACSKNSSESSTGTSAASAAPASAAVESSESTTPGQLPIPLSKLRSLPVSKGDAVAGAKAFAANCASCHGEGGKNGNVGPSLYGTGLKAGQVAYMIRNPAAIDKNSAMPKLQLSNKEVADIAAYVASLK